MGTARFHGTIRRRLAAVLLLGTFVLPAACTPVPTRQEASDMIAKYFDGRGYTVRRIEISEITPTPLGEKTYMGTKGYTVGISSITLVSKEDVGPPWNYKKDEQITFRGATMRIREKTAEERGWDVEVVSGIPVF
jgi:hypothetical protein